MTEEIINTDGAEGTPPENTTENGAPSAETEKPEREPTIPRERFDEVNERMKAAEAELVKAQKAEEKRRADEAKAEQERLEKQGEFEKLYADEQAKATSLESKLTAVNERLAKYEERIDAILDKRKEALPEHIKPLIDKMDKLDAMDYLTEHGEQLAAPQTGQPRKQSAPPLNATDGAGSGGGKPDARDVVLRRKVQA